ncbi:MAG: hypothetical protein JW843_02760 [Candidatus Aminicenantes bacterium]|nr:hypothetical protein [Candidatus Aminicenantes bacterium]
MALEDKTLPPDLKPNPVLIDKIELIKETDGTVSCAAAIALAERANVAPEEVGRTLDALAVRLSRCQIGTFGYPGHAKGWTISGADREPEPEGLRAALQEAAGPVKQVSCPTLWDIAEKFHISRMRVGYAADRAGLKINGCQLGAF